MVTINLDSLVQSGKDNVAPLHDHWYHLSAVKCHSELMSILMDHKDLYVLYNQ